MSKQLKIQNPQVDFHYSKLAFDWFLGKYNKSDDICQDANKKLKAGHAELFYILVRLYGSYWKERYDFARAIGHNRVEADLCFLPPLETNNVVLGRIAKRSMSTVQRYIKRLIDAGVIVKKVNHGPVNNYELYLNPALLAIYNVMQKVASLQFFETHYQSVKNSLRSICPPFTQRTGYLYIKVLNSVDKAIEKADSSDGSLQDTIPETFLLETTVKKIGKFEPSEKNRTLTAQNHACKNFSRGADGAIGLGNKESGRGSCKSLAEVLQNSGLLPQKSVKSLQDLSKVPQKSAESVESPAKVPQKSRKSLQKVCEKPLSNPGDDEKRLEKLKLWAAKHIITFALSFLWRTKDDHSQDNAHKLILYEGERVKALHYIKDHYFTQCWNDLTLFQELEKYRKRLEKARNYAGNNPGYRAPAAYRYFHLQNLSKNSFNNTMKFMKTAEQWAKINGVYKQQFQKEKAETDFFTRSIREFDKNPASLNHFRYVEKWVRKKAPHKLDAFLAYVNECQVNNRKVVSA